VISLHDEIVLAFNNYVREAENFEQNNVKASAARARKALIDLHKLSKERRKEIQERKNEL
jgi:ABC-type uncharacterized transport system involved in gliding motility auxiliary subunit